MPPLFCCRGHDLKPAAVDQRITASSQAKTNPGRSPNRLHAAGDFAELAPRLRERGHAPRTVPHFVNLLVFSLSGMPTSTAKATADFGGTASELFRATRDRGGRVGVQPVPWFNGGLFDDDTAPPLDAADSALLSCADGITADSRTAKSAMRRAVDPRPKKLAAALDGAKVSHRESELPHPAGFTGPPNEPAGRHQQRA